MDYSVIIITRNRAKVIAQTIDSVLKQTIKPTEFIIIDNNSTDGTIELLLKYKKTQHLLRDGSFYLKQIYFTE